MTKKKPGGRPRESEPQKIDFTSVVWHDDGLAFHVKSGLPVNGEVVKRWSDGVDMVEGRYVDGVHQGFGHRYYSAEGRVLARQDDEDQLRISTRYDDGGRLVERRARTSARELAWVERWDADGAPLATPAPPPLREALAALDPATVLSARRAVLDRGEQLRHRIWELRAAMERHGFMRNVLRESRRLTKQQETRRQWHKLAEIDLAPILARAEAELRVLESWYRGWVPRVPVARCPHSGRVVVFPLDNVDLDGWFWHYDQPERPYHWDELPATWLAMTGAVRLGQPLASVPFEVRPGPEVPYVIPRILGRRDDVRGVIAEVPIGPHTGWAVTYFALKQIPAKLVSTWGEATYHWRSDEGVWHWEDGGWSSGHFDFAYGDNDYDLAPWLRSGKLLWIAPNDGELTLRSGEAGCPYVGLPGSRHLSHIRDGKIWRAGS